MWRLANLCASNDVEGGANLSRWISHELPKAHCLLCVDLNMNDVVDKIIRL